MKVSDLKHLLRVAVDRERVAHEGFDELAHPAINCRTPTKATLGFPVYFS